MSESVEEWQNSKQIIDGILGKCVRLWLDLEKTEDEDARRKDSQRIRLGLQISSRYLRVLRMDDDVRQAAKNKALIEQSQAQIAELQRKLGQSGKDEGKAE